MNVQRVSILFMLSKHKILFSRIDHLALCSGRILVSHDKKQTHFSSNRLLWLHGSYISMRPTQLTFFVTIITTCHFCNYPGRLVHFNVIKFLKEKKSWWVAESNSKKILKTNIWLETDCTMMTFLCNQYK